MSSYQHLDAWKSCQELAVSVYRTTEPLKGATNPDAVELGLELRRLAILPAARVARGWGTRERRLFSHALSLAQGYLSEIEHQLNMAVLIGVLPLVAAKELEFLRAEAAFHVGKLHDTLLLPDRGKRKTTD